MGPGVPHRARQVTRGRGVYLAHVAADDHLEHQVAVALEGGIGHAVLEVGCLRQHELGRLLQALGRLEHERDPRAVGHLGDVALVLVHQLEPDPLRLWMVGVRAERASLI